MNDEDIVKSVRSGELDKYELLVERYQARLEAVLSYHCITPCEIEYYLHEAFVKAFFNLKKYNSKYSFFGWLRTIALNIIRDDLRSSKRYQKRQDNYLNYLQACRIEQSEIDLLAEERAHALQSCLNTLEEGQQELLSKRYRDALPIAELSRITGKQEGALKMQLRRLRIVLKNCIRKKILRINNEH